MDFGTYLSVGNWLNLCSNSELEQIRQYQLRFVATNGDYDLNQEYISLVSILIFLESGDEFTAAEVLQGCIHFVDLTATEGFIRMSRFSGSLTEKFHKYATIKDYQKFIKDFRSAQK